MNTTNTKRSLKVHPITLGLEDGLARKLRLICASRDVSMSAFVSGLISEAVAGLPNELADLIPRAADAEAA